VPAGLAVQGDVTRWVLHPLDAGLVSVSWQAYVLGLRPAASRARTVPALRCCGVLQQPAVPGVCSAGARLLFEISAAGRWGA
jgi:hypothetical protein